METVVEGDGMYLDPFSGEYDGLFRDVMEGDCR